MKNIVVDRKRSEGLVLLRAVMCTYPVAFESRSFLSIMPNYNHQVRCIDFSRNELHASPDRHTHETSNALLPLAQKNNSV